MLCFENTKLHLILDFWELSYSYCSKPRTLLLHDLLSTCQQLLKKYLDGNRDILEGKKVSELFPYGICHFLDSLRSQI